MDLEQEIRVGVCTVLIVLLITLVSRVACTGRMPELGSDDSGGCNATTVITWKYDETLLGD